jgi:pimeloyl-ACP methyl ester carboxylesterase
LNKDISFPPPPPPCTSTGSSCSADLLLGKGKVTYWRSYALDAPNAQVTRGVVVVHGSSLNADDYFGYVVSSAKAAGVLSSTIIVAPRFPESAGASDELYWSSEWRSGGDGSAPNGATISSYGVMDSIVTKLGDPSTFPKLSTVVVTGHSAGGQLAQRYGAAGKAAPAGVVMRYAPANPSSYLYFNDYRRVNGVFVNSGAAFSACTSYDDYKYGLKNRSGWPYLASQSDAALKGKYFSRVVVYLLGDADTCNSDLDSTCNDSGLAKSCRAMLQGDHRLERGQFYWLHINKYFGGHPHQLKVIPGVGHSGYQMFNSTGGRAVLFN